MSDSSGGVIGKASFWTEIWMTCRSHLVWRVQEGRTFQAKGTTKTNSLGQEYAWHLTKKARRPAWLPNCTGQGKYGRRWGKRVAWAGRPQPLPVTALWPRQLSELHFPQLQNTIYLAECQEDWWIKKPNSSSAMPAGNYHSLSTNYYHYYQHQHCYVNLRIHLWLRQQGVEIISFILDK